MPLSMKPSCYETPLSRIIDCVRKNILRVPFKLHFLCLADFHYSKSIFIQDHSMFAYRWIISSNRVMWHFISVTSYL